jgi:hypothetical protein
MQPVAASRRRSHDVSGLLRHIAIRNLWRELADYKANFVQERQDN